MALSSFKQTFLLGLLDIRDNGPKMEFAGICSNLESYVFDNSVVDKFEAEFECHIWLIETFVMWPKFSGNTMYPVPAPKYKRTSPRFVYQDTPNIWKFQYGALRYELLDFLIAQLVEEDRKA